MAEMIHCSMNTNCRTNESLTCQTLDKLNQALIIIVSTYKKIYYFYEYGIFKAKTAWSLACFIHKDMYTSVRWG